MANCSAESWEVRATTREFEFLYSSHGRRGGEKGRREIRGNLFSEASFGGSLSEPQQQQAVTF